VASCALIAEIGDIHRFDSQASVAKYAGLVWNRSQSGDFEAEHSRMIKSGNRYLLYYLLEAANSVRRCDSEFRRYYDLKFKEVNKYQHKRALALTARKLVVPDKAGVFGNRGLGIKTVDITNLSNDTGGVDLANTGDGGQSVRNDFKLLFNGLI